MDDYSRIRERVENYFHGRYTGYAGGEMPDFSRFCSGRRMEEEEKRYQYEVKTAKDKGLSFSDWQLNILFKRIAVMGNHARVEIEEQHRVVFPVTGFTPSSMKGLVHRLTLKKIRNQWYVTAHSTRDERVIYSAKCKPGGTACPKLIEETGVDGQGTKRIIHTYNREAAVRYARRWALGRNPAYYDFENLGGDCTNFCSQVIHAGGAPMNMDKRNGWYYISLNNRSPSWTGVEYLYRFLLTNRGQGPHGEMVALSEIEIGDIVQLDFPHSNGFNHSLTVVSNPQPGNINRILISTHTIDRDNYPLIFYNWRNIRYVHIIGYGI